MSGVAKAAALIVGAQLAGMLTGCTAPGAGAGGEGGGAVLTVFAAASLKAPFTRLAGEFEAGHPGTTVRLSFAGSSDLAAQITQGAPAEVFASADARNMARVSEASLVEGAPVIFATNVLAIAVPPDNPASLGTFADLARPGVKVVTCASQVPCGAAARAVEEVSGIDVLPVSEETSVTDVLGKVASGEADAGLVYVTDVLAAGDKVASIPFPEAQAVVNTYPITALRTGRNKDLAAAFIAAVTGSEGRRILVDAGFGAP